MTYNYQVTLQYDGTAYCGWQYQDPKHPTIQAELMHALQIIAKKRVVATGSSRTDAGVHASGLVANFHLPWAIEPTSLRKALNALLPDDIRVVHCEQAGPSFNARFGAKSKTYQYRLFFGQIQSPFNRLYAAHFPYPLDLREMRRATRHFLGQQDFSSFTSDEPEKNRIREIDEFSMRVKGEEILFTVRGKSFLRYMVRNMVGTVIDVGRGRIKAADVPAIFTARERRKAGQTAPAKGLTLLKVDY